MSTKEEIQGVYLNEIGRKSKFVRNKFGQQAFLGGLIGYSVFSLYADLDLDQIIVNDEPDTKIADGAPWRRGGNKPRIYEG